MCRPGSKRLLKHFLIGAGILIGLFTTASAQETRKDYFIFSHQFHIEDLGLECADCHADVVQSRSASDRVIPEHIECLVCHDGETAREECTLCHYDEENIQLSPTMDYEFKFSHETHLAIEDIDCERCHTGLEITDYASAENMPDMASCIQCHNDTEAPQNCNYCHTRLATLRPVSHIPTWIHRHDEAMRATSEDCTICHQSDFCQECHDGAVLVKSSPGIISNVPPDAQQNWNINNMVLQRNHPLNYQLTHPFEARNNPQRCQFCHDSELFCNTCHGSPDHASDIKPPWHGGPNWGAIALGLGTGGGRHARLARQDISLCVSCHDANGEDPACLLCHMDRIPGKNNDLRSHSNNLFKNVRGPWHEDESYTCFTCHINAQRNIPTSFCGYCHSVR